MFIVILMEPNYHDNINNTNYFNFFKTFNRDLVVTSNENQRNILNLFNILMMLNK